MRVRIHIYAIGTTVLLGCGRADEQQPIDSPEPVCQQPSKPARQTDGSRSTASRHEELPLMPGTIGFSHNMRELDVHGLNSQQIIDRYGEPKYIYRDEDMPGWPLPPYVPDEDGIRRERGRLPNSAKIQWKIVRGESRGVYTFFFDEHGMALLGISEWSDL